ncbi:MAG: hypothetical protein FD144_5877 [Rhodospirillaceae bacterium]|nr:MAG: hypothetical protein FD144_5877 [Rhodospirillaceae bacterium]
MVANHLPETRNTPRIAERRAPRVGKGMGPGPEARKVTPAVRPVTDAAVKVTADTSATPILTRGRSRLRTPAVAYTAPARVPELQKRDTARVQSLQGVETQATLETGDDIRDALRDNRRLVQDADLLALAMATETGTGTGMAMEMGTDMGMGTGTDMGMDTAVVTARAPVRVIPARATAATTRTTRAQTLPETLAST